VTPQNGLECAYATITNTLTLLNSKIDGLKFLLWLKSKRQKNKSFNLSNLDICVDIGCYNTTKELFRTLLFNVTKKTRNDKIDWVLPSNFGMWPIYLQTLALSAPEIL